MACVTKRNGKWWIDYRDRQGRRHREVARTRKDAQELLAKRTGEIAKNTYQSPGQETRFQELAERWSREYVDIEVKPNTARDYKTNMRLYVRPFFDGYKLVEITVRDVERFRASLVEQGVGRRTVNKCLTMIGSMFRYAQKHGWMHANPTEHVPKLKTQSTDSRDVVDAAILSPAEIDRVLEKAGKWRLVIATAVMTGLREGELLGLRWPDVDFNKREIQVRQQSQRDGLRELKTKNARRNVPIPQPLVRELMEWKLQCPKGDHSLVFPNGNGNPENPSNLLRRGFYPALRKAKVRQIRFHDLRHCYVSALIASGVNIKVIQHLVGHADIGTTLNVYGHLLPDSTDGIADALASKIAPKWSKCPESGHQMVISPKSTDGKESQVIELQAKGL